MLELKTHSIAERLWPAGMVAFVMHSLMIAAVALGINYAQGRKEQVLFQDLHVDVMFESPIQKGDGKNSEKETQDKGVFQERARFLDSLNGKISDQPIDKSLVESHLQNQKVSHTKPSKRLKKKDSLEESGFQPASSSSMAASSETAGSSSLYNPPPIYPLEARRKKLQGVVQIKISLTPEGTVDSAVTLPPRMNPILEDAALMAVRNWRFKPGIKTLEVPIEFRLET